MILLTTLTIAGAHGAVQHALHESAVWPEQVDVQVRHVSSARKAASPNAADQLLLSGQHTTRICELGHGLAIAPLLI